MLTYKELLVAVARLTEDYPNWYGYTETHDPQQNVYVVFKSRRDSFDVNKAIARLYYTHG